MKIHELHNRAGGKKHLNQVRCHRASPILEPALELRYLQSDLQPLRNDLQSAQDAHWHRPEHQRHDRSPSPLRPLLTRPRCDHHHLKSHQPSIYRLRAVKIGPLPQEGSIHGRTAVRVIHWPVRPPRKQHPSLFSQRKSQSKHR